jgi:hypothetical protein
LRVALRRWDPEIIQTYAIKCATHYHISRMVEEMGTVPQRQVQAAAA